MGRAPRFAALGLIAPTLAAGLGRSGPLPDFHGPTATYELHDGRQMPVFGLGVYVTKAGDEAVNSVKWALELGYRMIDTAKIYGNERSVGEAIRASGIPREEIWVTSKLWDADHGYEQTLAAGMQSLEEMGLDYMDLYLVHSPQGGKLVETWDAMLELKRRGLAKSVGVSNYNVNHLEALTQHQRELPVVNQFEMHPKIFRERLDLIEYCESHNILVQAYGSIFFGKTEFLEDPAVVEVASQHPDKTKAQVLLRWGLQNAFQIIPKSTKKHRLEENMKIFDFELSTAQMERLSSMGGALGAYWNPLTAPLDLGDTSRSQKTEL